MLGRCLRCGSFHPLVGGKGAAPSLQSADEAGVSCAREGRGVPVQPSFPPANERVSVLRRGASWNYGTAGPADDTGRAWPAACFVFFFAGCVFAPSMPRNTKFFSQSTILLPNTTFKKTF